jgi:hypothetical protein
MKEDKGLRLFFDKGWSLMNIFTGIILVIFSWLMAIVDGFFVGSHAFMGDAGPINIGFGGYLVLSFAFVMIVLGSLGFWFVIPAFQKWGHTKPWLAWVFLTIAVLILLACFFLVKTI